MTGVIETAEKVRSGRGSAVDAVGEALACIAARNDELNAFVHVDADGALAAAREVDRRRERGEDPGPLAGVPLGVKELHAVAGWPHTLGSASYAGRVADVTCTLVARAVAAGAVPIGLTASPEFGRASFTASELHGVTRNPWDPALTPGGSSGGSAAAVAGGMVPVATGTDGAGSLRIPASYCGLVGFKPTYGVVPRGPRHRGTGDNDHYGVLTRTVRDTARVLDVVCGVDPFDRASLPAPSPGFEQALQTTLVSGLRVGFVADLGNAPCDPEVAQVAEAAAQRFITGVRARRVPVAVQVDPACGQAFRTLTAADAYLDVTSAPNRAQIHPTVGRYVEAAERLGVRELLHAHEVRAQLIEAMARVFDDIDLLLTPATQLPAFVAQGPMPTEIAGTPVDHWGALAATFPFNLTGQPAVSVPAGFAGGAPIGLQLVGRRHADTLVLAAAAVAAEDLELAATAR